MEKERWVKVTSESELRVGMVIRHAVEKATAMLLGRHDGVATCMGGPGQHDTRPWRTTDSKRLVCIACRVDEGVIERLDTGLFDETLRDQGRVIYGDPVVRVVGGEVRINTGRGSVRGEEYWGIGDRPATPIDKFFRRFKGRP